ncbi:MAG TPA: CRTAC1 family protein, partial [Segetibacter sp.]|nr:CRTAC1 family protein [Segetibacter sp.]
MILRDLILRFPLFASLLLIVLTSWTGRNTNETKGKTSYTSDTAPLFTLLPASQTGVDFTNTIYENDALNILNEAYIYNGGGVGIGDFNNDGLEDVYFSGNMVSNKLYLNKGSLKFADVTEAAGVGSEGKWCSGVSVADINGDGWMDIYVSSTFLKDPDLRKNLLFINQGLNKEGIPTFKESAKAYGIDDDGYSTQGVFFDYDNDGDLDLYIVTNVMDRGTPVAYRPKITDGSAPNTDRLYRNNGNQTFTNVSRQAGILIEGWGHAVSITDVNLDGYSDIYVSNDFVANDILYVNNKDGTFTDRITDYFKHTGWSTMGTDMVDINNDGLIDLVSLEMLPESNSRKKSMLMGDNYITYINNKKFNYQHQYIRNVLQLNCGMTPEGHPVFSDVAFMADMYQTDWSWDPLVADFDNDGYRDMIITNGYPRDVTDLDYISYDNGQGTGAVNSTLAKVDALPVVKISNYAYKNTGGFTFSNTTKAWGLYKPSFSNGGAYADLDNDGDLDLVINNINDPSFIYENTLNSNNQKEKEHSLTVRLAGIGMNISGTGASLRIYYNGKQQLYEQQPCRGYLSTVDARAHFGLGAVTNIDSLRVRWPDGKSQLLTNIKADKPLTLSYKDAAEAKPVFTSAETPLFISAAARYGIQFKHEQKDVVDFNIQPTLPHKFSQYGPGIAVGDVDNNGFDDFYISGSPGKQGVFFMQDAKGHFSMDTKRFIQNNAPQSQELGVLLFDADNDKDLDLYVVTGSYELPANHPANQDRLYLNNGKGKFLRSLTALPKMPSNGSCVRAADIDGDGDLDL